ncbi:hypothetical protein [Glutamicibacter sp. AOP3-A1-12]|uniref:hypothetical protein n=1 Tax=Glutamicibacter sp. AOP3-A1-12 TaxID=3457701 RepID=UPI0040344645
MKLTGTARGGNFQEVLEDADAQIKQFFGDIETKAAVGDFYSEREELPYTDRVNITFYAEFTATPKEAVL